MEHIRSYILSVCFAIVFCVIVTMLIPSQKFEKIIRVALGVFIVATLIKPIANIMNNDWQIDENILLNLPTGNQSAQLSFSESDFLKAVYSSAEKSAKVQIECAFKNMNIKFDQIDVKYSKGCICVEINGVEPKNMQTVEEYIEKNYGVKPKVTE